MADVLLRHCHDKQVLVFCSSKKSTEGVCALLAKHTGVRQAISRMARDRERVQLNQQQQLQRRNFVSPSQQGASEKAAPRLLPVMSHERREELVCAISDAQLRGLVRIGIGDHFC